MKALRALAVAGLVLGAPIAAAAAPPAQQLSITIHGDGARATQLPQYDPAAPIAVSVRETGGVPIDAITVIATGPAAEHQRTPLTRAADGTFSGTLSLPDPGLWRLRMTSRAGKLNVDTSPVTLNVEAPPPSNAWQIGVAVGVLTFAIVGGSGFLILRRVLARKTGRAQPA